VYVVGEVSVTGNELKKYPTRNFEKHPVALYQLLAYDIFGAAVLGGEKKKTPDLSFHNERDLRILVCEIG
jgi:hypothetical protein